MTAEEETHVAPSDVHAAGEEYARLLRAAAERGASDLHLHIGSPPMVRTAELEVLDGFAKITPDYLAGLAEWIMNEKERARFEEGEEVDTSIGVAGVGRFRANIYRQRGSIGIVLRRIENRIPSFEELCLPPVVEYLTRFERGLVLVTGTTGSGKSTTLAAMVDYINEHKRVHIVTIEDPIEYLHRNKQGIVTQREIGKDTKDFAHALRAVMRQDPDVILIGEMRDAETIQAALTAAETGHLVFSTLHTATAPQTVERILEYFPGALRPVIQKQLALFLIGVVSQRLLSRADGSGLIPAVEVMLNNPIVRKCLLQGKVENLKSVIHHSNNEGMQTFDQHLVQLYNSGLVSFEEAAAASSNMDNFHLMCRGFFGDVSAGMLDV